MSHTFPLESGVLRVRRPKLPHLYDQNFGVGLSDDVILRPSKIVSVVSLRSGYLRPWRNSTAEKSGVSTIICDKNEFRVSLDVQQFKPEELKVYVSDGFIVVEGKHEEREDEQGFVSRQFIRKYKVPNDVDDATLTSNFSSDGVLTLKAAKKARPERKGREIPITVSNEPAEKRKKIEQTEKMEQ